MQWKKQLPSGVIKLDNLQRPLVLPSLELSTVDLQSVSSLFSHKQICKKVCEWFTEWRSWQQRILLCGVSEKCTKSQLQAFVTMLVHNLTVDRVKVQRLQRKRFLLPVSFHLARLVCAAISAHKL